MARRLAGGIAALIIGSATALVILGVATILLLNPIWVGIEQARAESGLLTGYGPAELREATNGILGDLIVGPPDFDVQVNGAAVLTDRERDHMRDVRGVFLLFFAAVLGGVATLSISALVSRRSPAYWRRIRRGARWLAVVVVVVGFVGLLFFDAAFELFHRLFFSSGTYTFDPATDRLVQLFPTAFWVDTTIVLGGIVVSLGYVAGELALRRARRAAIRLGEVAVPVEHGVVAGSAIASPEDRLAALEARLADAEARAARAEARTAELEALAAGTMAAADTPPASDTTATAAGPIESGLPQRELPDPAPADPAPADPAPADPAEPPTTASETPSDEVDPPADGKAATHHASADAPPAA